MNKIKEILFVKNYKSGFKRSFNALKKTENENADQEMSRMKVRTRSQKQLSVLNVKNFAGSNKKTRNI